ncbi:hypothetical protein GALMADRAFT_136574 [Galerina marginata CBS 339.88]|uniref:Uncharacterized protein n=1 Tax=Galerina marginata (strain CBS 339.88) TaxID=685588 RepID=A0A067T9Z5_GALM3|nr:hypothetical protein GALMADRAFT_136574 [Galerina marginata CBS 339.88]
MPEVPLVQRTGKLSTATRQGRRGESERQQRWRWYSTRLASFTPCHVERRLTLGTPHAPPLAPPRRTTFSVNEADGDDESSPTLSPAALYNLFEQREHAKTGGNARHQLKEGNRGSRPPGRDRLKKCTAAWTSSSTPTLFSTASTRSN